MKTPIITETPAVGSGGPQANFSKSAFDQLIWNKGYEVLKETALKCPCKGKATNQQSNCRNCGGTGWIFINPTDTKVVLHSMNLNTKYKEWSEENAGNASMTAMQEEEIAFMDRITVKDTNAIHQQVLYLKTNDPDESTSQSESQSHESGSESDSSSEVNESTYFFTTIYDIKEILHIAIYSGSQNPLIPLVYGTDFTYRDNKIILTLSTAKTYIDKKQVGDQDVSITIRYKYAVQFHVVDIPRETIQSRTKAGIIDNPEVINLPIHAILRRSHYVLDEENLEGNRINNNDHLFVYDEVNPPMNGTC
jgi:hypothetical protein